MPFKTLGARFRELITEADVVRYGGEVFKMTGKDENGVRYLLGKDGSVAGQVNSDDSLNVFGDGEPESEHKKRTGRKYIPKVTGWDVTYDDIKTKTRVGKFFPLDIGIERVNAFAASQAEQGLDPKVRDARGKSRWPNVMGHKA